MDKVFMTVNLLLAIVQAFWLGMKWEQHKREAASRAAAAIGKGGSS